MGARHGPEDMGQVEDAAVAGPMDMVTVAAGQGVVAGDGQGVNRTSLATSLAGERAAVVMRMM
eukprot:CAMPEP_0172183872 /NCGR_PEP_ID=MMETSP1050-20130122/19244_1 /TAXON_ID=233186 /ORGANISM="Cryptomonas curvata, Strain CCAP979/52" /LENGTH=62 /DNA_ID=CAMNT_0012857573 /DNA_START=64 /DNA_END=249 /DNA_ORIENTATION=+